MLRVRALCFCLCGRPKCWIAAFGDVAGPETLAGRVRLAVEKVEVVLADEEFRAVNRIATRRRGNRYVLYSDCIGAGAAGIVTCRVNEQVKRNIQWEVIHRSAIERCGAIRGYRPHQVGVYRFPGA